MTEITILCNDDESSVALREKIIELVKKEFENQAVIIPGTIKRPKPKN